jgi:hypothetical protein
MKAVEIKKNTKEKNKLITLFGSTINFMHIYLVLEILKR